MGATKKGMHGEGVVFAESSASLVLRGDEAVDRIEATEVLTPLRVASQ